MSIYFGSFLKQRTLSLCALSLVTVLASTDARLYAEAGIPTVLYGAGPRTILESGAKRADEHLVLEDLRKATQVIANCVADFLS